MAKRKRLGPAALVSDEAEAPAHAPEIKAGRPVAVPPIAQVAGASAAEAALREISDEFAGARAEGRLVQTLALDAIEAGYLKRDRMVADAEEMAALKASIAERGQQVPVDVVDLEQGRYGLISGWRRLQALRELQAETGEARFSEIRAVLRRPVSAADAYLSMIEENELRAGLSYYERAQVAARAAQDDVFEDSVAAIAALFPTASKAKRSKIASFVRVYDDLDDMLRFPWEIGERLGLKLARALAGGQGAELRSALKAADAQGPEAEMKALTSVLDATTRSTEPQERVSCAVFSGGIEMNRTRGGLKLSGPGINEAFLRDLTQWLSERQSRQSRAG